MSLKPLRVLHLPSFTGGNAYALVQGERKLGLRSEQLVTEEGRFGYPADINLHLDRFGPLGRLLRAGTTFLKVRNRYDIFHFNFGSTLLHARFGSSLPRPLCRLLNQLDLPFYPKRSKLFVTYNGCDIRQKYPTMERTKIAACHQEMCYDGVCNDRFWDGQRQRAMEKMGRYVDHMWALNPDLLHFLPKENSSFLPYTVCNWETKLYPPHPRGKLLIVHAPTQRVTKGTLYLFEAIDQLKREFPSQFEVRLVEGLPFQEALAIYRRADLIVDQLLIGWYGGFAVECMLMGKPVVVRIAEEDLCYLPSAMAEELRGAVIWADPSTVYEQLRRAIEDRLWLMECGKRAAAYARRWHDPAYVASLTKEKYEG